MDKPSASDIVFKNLLIKASLLELRIRENLSSENACDRFLASHVDADLSEGP